MIKADYYYKQNLKTILDYGSEDENPRPKYTDGTPAYSKFITQVWEEYNIDKGEYPLTTLRNTAVKIGINEVLWIYQKQSNCLTLAREMGIHWWNDWDIGDNTIGNRYGYTINKYNLMDNILNGLLNDPFGRRHVINMLQYEDLNSSEGLYPCAFETLWSVRKIEDTYYLDLTLNQRSNDYLMAGYINKMQYVALQMMVVGHMNSMGKNYKIGKFCHLVQNLHIYDRHIEAANELLSREDISEQGRLELNVNKNFYEYELSDFNVILPDGINKLSSKLELAI
jgi:thymidylate synthase